MAQLPDRDMLVEKFKDPATSSQATIDLVVYYQLGGVRTIIRNMNSLAPDTRLGYGHALMHLDLFRFRNDLNANLEETDNPDSRALYLQMLATCGRQLDFALFEGYMNDTSQPIHVRLAAASGIVKVQNPSYYDQFYEIAEDAEIDPASGRDDFQFADISMKNQGFYYYTKGKLNKDNGTMAHVLTAISMAEPGSVSLYNALLDLKWKKIVPLMIDHAVTVGGVDLLNAMAEHKTAKKYRDEIEQALPAATDIATYLKQGIAGISQEEYPIGPVAPVKIGGAGDDDWRSAFGILKVNADGSAELLAYRRPFGVGSDKMKETIASFPIVPAFHNFEPAESFALLIAP